jgi:glutamate dehydrogenase
VLEIARGFFLLGERLQIDWLETQLEGMAAGTRWRRWAQQSMEDDLFNLRRQVAEKILEVSDGVPIDEAVETFLTERPDADERLRRFMRQLAMEGVTDLAQLTVALRQIRALVG